MAMGVDQVLRHQRRVAICRDQGGIAIQKKTPAARDDFGADIPF
jgi:hypothetical protein